MARVIVDTSFLSSILKADLLEKTLDILDKRKLFITQEVERELQDSHLYTMNRDKIGEEGPIIPLQREEDNHQEDLSFLGKGEASCIFYCLKADARFLVDDREARNKARELGIKTLTIPDLLDLGKVEDDIDKEDMNKVIQNLQESDNYIFSDEVKEKLLDYS